MLESVHVQAQRHSDIQENAAIPALLQDTVIPYDHYRTFQCAAFTSLLQERKGTDGSLLYFTTLAHEDVTVGYNIAPPCISLLLSAGNAGKITCGPHTLLLHPHALNLFFQAAQGWQLHLQAGMLSEIIFITYPVTYLQQLTAYYPVLSPFTEATGRGEYRVLCSENRVAPPNLVNNVFSLIHKQYDTACNLYPVFYEARSRDTLIEALDCFSVSLPSIQQVLKKQQDFNTIHQIRKAISEQPERRPGLQELARLAGWNKDKLSKGFRQVYNMSVMEYFHQVQMEHAKKLVESTDMSIKEISHTLGLLNQNFSRDFKTYYGKPPIYFRNMKNNNHSK